MNIDNIPIEHSPVVSRQSIKEIKKLHAEIFNAARTTLPKAIRIGELLTGLKDKTKHGKWLSWIEKHLPFAERTAQNYMRCFEERERLKSATIADLPLSMSGALELISEPETAPASSVRLAELQTNIRRSIEEIKSDLAEISNGYVPDMAINSKNFGDYIESQGIKLVAGDEKALPAISTLLESDIVFTSDEILEILRWLNPVRAGEVIA